MDEDVIRAWNEAVAARDLDRARALLHEQASFHIGGRNPFSGDYQGRDRVLNDLFRRVSQVLDRIDVTLHDVISSRDHTVALTERTLHRGPRTFVTRSVTVYHVRDGRILEAWTYEADQTALDEFVSA